ncbi:hypothetical protein L9F63_022609 [Diploptera punctata]|uniref:MADF domain-containing protein n=1 Tax=Diploptera punctata TaxID=6984 RepID=A0AAD7ZLR4_DIPPU|nr:hypothetical protein L9F63_022609 [Diploptera punctata]
MEASSSLGEITEKLIASVKERPALYNNKIREFSDRNIKEQLWQEVCEMVVTNWRQLTPDERINKMRDVQNRWQNLRTCFKRELKAQKRDQFDPLAKRRRKYVYFDSLLFLLTCYDGEADPVSMPDYYEVKLEPLVEDVTTENDVSSMYSSEEQTGGFEIYTAETNSLSEGNENDSHFLKTQETMSSNEGSRKDRVGQAQRSGYEQIVDERRKKRKLGHENEEKIYEELEDSRMKQSDNILTCFEESVVTILKQKINEDIDEDKAFLLSLLPMFRKFNDDQKLDAKIEILRVMRNVNKSCKESQTHLC